MVLYKQGILGNSLLVENVYLKMDLYLDGKNIVYDNGIHMVYIHNLNLLIQVHHWHDFAFSLKLARHSVNL